MVVDVEEICVFVISVVEGIVLVPVLVGRVVVRVVAWVAVDVEGICVVVVAVSFVGGIVAVPVVDGRFAV